MVLLHKSVSIHNLDLEFSSLQAISEGEDLEELLKQQERRRLAMEAALEAEEIRNVGELEMRLNEEHKEEVKQLHKNLLEKVRLVLFARDLLLVVGWEKRERIKKKIPLFPFAKLDTHTYRPGQFG